MPVPQQQQKLLVRRLTKWRAFVALKLDASLRYSLEHNSLLSSLSKSQARPASEKKNSKIPPPTCTELVPEPDEPVHSQIAACRRDKLLPLDTSAIRRTFPWKTSTPNSWLRSRRSNSRARSSFTLSPLPLRERAMIVIPL